jgi:flagellar hook-length control protein FliK
MDSILAALLNSPQVAGATAQTQAQTQTPSSADAGSSAQFKAQFDQAVAALTNANAPATQGTTTTTTTTAAQTTAAGSLVVSAANADLLQASLQKKIADLLQQGETVAQIVQQLAASLASTLAQHFGLDPTQVQSQLQSVIASALSPPSTGPPLSNADLASALAQQFRQVADVAAGVLGETGQSNRLFAGSISDAATTAGVQPAPQTSDNNPAPADSTATDASALLASLTAASQGDGKTVATNGAQALGSNGDTLLGRILARAAQAQLASGSQTSTASASDPAGTSRLALSALAAASAALDNGAATAPVATVTPAAITTSILANAASSTAANSGSDATVAAPAPAPLSPAVLSFIKTFTDALASTSAPTIAKTTGNDDTPGTLLQTTDLSSQAPSVGAFAPVQAAVQNDSVGANGSQPASQNLPSPTTADPNQVVEQILHGLSLNTVDTTSTVRMRLVPQELGDVSVKLTIEGNSVSAQVMAQTPQAHDALVAGQAQLTRAFEDAGLKLTSFNVDLAGGFASFQQQQQQQQTSQQQGSSTGSTLIGGVDTAETDESQLVAAPNFGPPVLTGVSWSALNYLA